MYKVYRNTPAHPAFDSEIIDRLEAMTGRIAGECPRVGTLPPAILRKMLEAQRVLLELSDLVEKLK